MFELKTPETRDQCDYESDNNSATWFAEGSLRVNFTRLLKTSRVKRRYLIKQGIGLNLEREKMSDYYWFLSLVRWSSRAH